MIVAARTMVSPLAARPSAAPSVGPTHGLQTPPISTPATISRPAAEGAEHAFGRGVQSCGQFFDGHPALAGLDALGGDELPAERSREGASGPRVPARR
jgi:hypothetical protein